jgi:hypothetical protein
MTIYQQINATRDASGLPTFTETAAYSVYLETETEKYYFIQAARAAGATVAGVSGCGRGYYIQIDATPEQAETINRTAYTAEIDRYTPAQAWAAWKEQRLTVGQMAIYQERHRLRFDHLGRVQYAGGAAL